jgi:hypothetical protein
MLPMHKAHRCFSHTRKRGQPQGEAQRSTKPRTRHQRRRSGHVKDRLDSSRGAVARSVSSHGSTARAGQSKVLSIARSRVFSTLF